MELSVLTLNVWGIPFISSDRVERITAIGTKLNEGKYDIVSLQEVWSQHDCDTLKEMVATTLPFNHYFFSGVMGAGLLILSKYPIIATLFHAWTVNGYFHRIQHADWFGGKGVGLCKILIGEHLIHIYNAHLHAEYNDEDDDYKTHRVLQAFEAAQFVEATRGESALQLLAGDLNIQPEDICFKLLLYTSGLSDCCISDEIITSDSFRNSYTPKYILAKNPVGIRIDHILMRAANNVDVTIMDYALAFPDRVSGCKYSFSDHEAVKAKFKIEFDVTKKPQALNCPATTFTGIIGMVTGKSHCKRIKDSSPHITVLKKAIILCEQELVKLRRDRIIYNSSAIFLLLMLIALAEYTVPLGLKTLFQCFRFALFAFTLFFFFMGSIWNLIECNNILAGKLSMGITLRSAER